MSNKQPVTFFQKKTKSKFNPVVAAAQKTSLLILLEAAGAQIPNIQSMHTSDAKAIMLQRKRNAIFL